MESPCQKFATLWLSLHVRHPVVPEGCISAGEASISANGLPKIRARRHHALGPRVSWWRLGCRDPNGYAGAWDCSGKFEICAYGRVLALQNPPDLSGPIASIVAACPGQPGRCGPDPGCLQKRSCWRRRPLYAGVEEFSGKCSRTVNPVLAIALRLVLCGLKPAGLRLIRKRSQ